MKFFGEHATLADAGAFRAWLAPLRRCEWVVYAKRPFAGPKAVLAYLSRYTHREAISNSRLISMDERGVTFRWKDYRAKGRTRYKAMSLLPQEFMRRFLLHVLPGGFHRIRHYGLLANGGRKANLELARELLHVAPAPAPAAGFNEQVVALPVAVPPTYICRHCGHALPALRSRHGHPADLRARWRHSCPTTMTGRLRQNRHAMPTTTRSSVGSPRARAHPGPRSAPAMSTDSVATAAVAFVVDLRGHLNTANAGDSVATSAPESP